MGNLCLVLLVVTDNGEDSETATDSEDARCVLLLVLGVGFFKTPSTFENHSLLHPGGFDSSFANVTPH
jgi:hypothetical protein